MRFYIKRVVKYNKQDIIKIISIWLITIILSCYMPVISLASTVFNDKRKTAIVPGVANDILSEFINTGDISNNNVSNESLNLLTDYSDEGDGWSSVTVLNVDGVERRYRNYKQYKGSYAGNLYWDGTIASDACGPSCVAIVLSGYGYDYNPGQVVDIFHQNGHNDSTSFDYLAEVLNDKGIETKYKYTSNGSANSNDVIEIRKNLKEGRPVIINAPGHYVVYVGEDEKGNLIISDPGCEDGKNDRYGATLEDVLNNGNITCGYILITSNGDSNSFKKQSEKVVKDQSNEKLSDDNNKEKKGSGSVISTSDFNSIGGYSGIYESRITGKKFKEYKQNSTWVSFQYPDWQWRTECLSVVTIILGSGYSTKADFSDLSSKLGECGGLTYMDKWIKDYTGQNPISCSKLDMLNNMKDGCVAIIHSVSYSALGHYMALLDINQDGSQVYLSNPWGGDSRQGWISVSDLDNFALDEIYCIANDGNIVNYTGSTQGNTSSLNMGSKIVSNNRNGYKIDINLDDKVNEMFEQIEKEGFNVNPYITSKNKKQYFKNFLRASIVTQYPDLRSSAEISNGEEIKADEVQGCIKIKRYADMETLDFYEKKENEYFLAYIPYENFMKMISDGNKEVLSYFTINSNNNILVAGWETLDVSMTMNSGGDPNPDNIPESRGSEKKILKTVSIDFISQITKYEMPFSLLWTLLVYSHDENFVNNLANLAINTEIIIGVYDATTTKVTTYTDEYLKTVLVTDNVIQEGSKGSMGQASKLVNYQYVITEVDTLKIDTPNLKIIYADAWMARYNNGYDIVVKNENVEGSVSVLDDRYIGTENESIRDKKLIESDELAQNVINKKWDQLRNENIQNNEKFSYRYSIIEQALERELVNEENLNVKKFLLVSYATNEIYVRDIQNYIINMVINLNTNNGIDNIFWNDDDEVIHRYAKLIDVEHYEDVIKSSVNHIKNIINNIVLNNDSENNLWKRITNNNKDLLLNNTYSLKVVGISKSTKIDHKNVTSKIDNDITDKKIEEKTLSGNNIKNKIDKNAIDDNFVKILLRSGKAKSNLYLIKTWLFESVEQTSAIANYEDLIKYFFQYVYSLDYGLNDSDISEWIENFSILQGTGNKSSTILSGNSIEEQVWNFFVKQGCSDEVAAGIMGNFYQESCMDPTCDAGVARGIAMFEAGTGNASSLEKYAASKGKEWTDLQCQLEFLFMQLPEAFRTYTGNGVYTYDTGELAWWPDEMLFEEYKQIHDVELAAEIFSRVYERPSLPMMDRRKRSAREYYEKYHKV